MIERSDVETRLTTLTEQLAEARTRRSDYASALTHLDTQIAQLQGACAVLQALLAPAEPLPAPSANGGEPPESLPP